VLIDFSRTPLFIDSAASPTTLVFRVRRQLNRDAFSGEVRTENASMGATFKANGIDGLTLEYRLSGIQDRVWFRVWSAAPAQNGWKQVSHYVNVWPDRVRIGSQAEPTEHDLFTIRMTDYDPASMTFTPGELVPTPSLASTFWDRISR